MSATTAEVTPADDEARLRETLAAAGRACCCPARAVVVAIIPPAAGRPNATDLLLCGHHYRACRDALEAAGATAWDFRPRPEIRHGPSDELLASRSLLTNPKEEGNTR